MSCQTLPGLPRASHVAPPRARAAAKRQHVRGRAAQILRSRRETSFKRQSDKPLLDISHHASIAADRVVNDATGYWIVDTVL